MTQQQTPQPTSPDPYRKPERKVKLSFAAFGIGAAVTAVVLMAVLVGPKASGLLKPEPPTTYTVTYEADSEGTAAGSITLDTPTGTQQEEVALPLKSQAGDTGLTFPTQPGAFVYLSVQNHNDSGSVTCRITIKTVTGNLEVSRVISENTSSGGHVIASCKGRVS